MVWPTQVIAVINFSSKTTTGGPRSSRRSRICAAGERVAFGDVTLAAIPLTLPSRFPSLFSSTVCAKGNTIRDSGGEYPDEKGGGEEVS